MLPIEWCAFRFHEVCFTVLAIVPLVAGALVLASFNDALVPLLPIIAASWVRTNDLDFSSRASHIITERNIGATTIINYLMLGQYLFVGLLIPFALPSHKHHAPLLCRFGCRNPSPSRIPSPAASTPYLFLTPCIPQLSSR